MAATDKNRGTWALESDNLGVSYATTGWMTLARDVRKYQAGLLRLAFTRGTSGMTSLTFRLMSADAEDPTDPDLFMPLTRFVDGVTAGEDESFILDASADFERDIPIVDLRSVAYLALQAKGSHVKGNSVLTAEFLGYGDSPKNQAEDVA